MRHVHFTNAPIQYSKIDLAASGAVAVALPSKRIVVLSYKMTAAGAVTAKWQSVVVSPSSTTDLSGAMTMATGVPIGETNEEYGVLQGIAGGNLYLLLGSGVQVSGHITYIYEDAITGQ